MKIMGEPTHASDCRPQRAAGRSEPRRRPERSLPSALSVLLCLAWWSVSMSPSWAVEAPRVEAELLAHADAVRPGDTLRAAVRLKIEPDWHVYWRNGGDSGVPTRIDWSLPEGWSAGEIDWPLPTRFIDGGGLVSYGYEHEVLLLTTLRVPADAAVGSTARLEAKVRWLACKEACVPGAATVELSLPVIAGDRTGKPGAGSDPIELWKRRLPVSAEAMADRVKLSARAMPPSPNRDGARSVEIVAVWRGQAPMEKAIQWFPAPPESLLVEDIREQTREGQTRITARIKPLNVGGAAANRLDSVLVFADERGQRHGVSIPIDLP